MTLSALTATFLGFKKLSLESKTSSYKRFSRNLHHLFPNHRVLFILDLNLRSSAEYTNNFRITEMSVFHSNCLTGMKPLLKRSTFSMALIFPLQEIFYLFSLLDTLFWVSLLISSGNTFFSPNLVLIIRYCPHIFF